MSLPFVSLVVPVYNEAGRIQSSLERMLRYFVSSGFSFEVIAVDDGSTDTSREKIAAVAQRDQRVRIVSFSTNHGKGFAVRQGVLKAEGEIVMFTDADLSTPMEEIEKAVQEILGGLAVVIGSRQHPASEIRVRQSYLRERIGRWFNWLVRGLLGLPFRDTQCGFKGFSRKAAREIFSRVRIDGFAFDVEVLLIARRLDYSVKEIPIRWSDSAASRIRPVRDSLRTFQELIAIYYNDRKGFYSHPRPS